MLSNYSKLKKILDHLKDPKIFLSLFVSLIWFIGFSSASYTFTSSESDWFYFYSPSDFTLSDDLEVSVLDYSCSFNTCQLKLDWSEYDENRMMPECIITYSNWNISLDWTCNFSAQTIETSNPNYDSSAFSSITIWDSSENVWWWTDDNSSGIISWWVSAFTPIISSVSSIISEFIPYVVYIGLGILGVIIWFVAIKRLINWIRAKIFSSFK